MMTSGHLIRQARRSAGLTQAQLAARLGTSQPVIARLEGRGSNPTWETLRRTLRATGHEVQLAPTTMATVSADIDQLRERLRLTPAQRLRTFQESYRRLAGLRAKARRTDDG